MRHAFLILSALTGLLAASCSVKEDRATCTAPVSVTVKDFAVSLEDLPSKTPQTVTSYSGITAITFAIFSGDTQVYKNTQERAQSGASFGSFSRTLEFGTYTVVAVGYGLQSGDTFFLTSPTAAGFTTERARETFCATDTFTVSDTAPINLDLTLQRIVSQLYVNSTDNRSAAATKVRVTYAAGERKFNPTTGLATEDTGFSVTSSISDNKPIGVNCGYLFLAADQQEMDITIETLDNSNNVLFTKVVKDVPFRRNRKTVLSGPLFTAESAAEIQVEATWLAEEPVSF